MEITVHSGRLTDFIRGRAGEGGQRPTAQPSGLSIVGGGIVRRNLRDTLTKGGVPAGSVSSYSTIEDIASQLVRAGTDSSQSQVGRQFRLRLMEAILAEAEEGTYSDTFQAFARGVTWREESTLDQLDSELDEYFRCTDADADHDELQEVTQTAPSQFIRSRGELRLSNLRELGQILEEQLEDVDEDVFLSRSHLVKEAREHVAAHWEDEFGHAEWVAVGTINVLDNPTLRLLLEIGMQDAAPDLHFFFQNGSREHFIQRFEAIEAIDQVNLENTETGIDSDVAETLLGGALGRGKDSDADSLDQDKLSFVEAPERRREVEEVVREIREDLRNGTDPSEILVVARDSGMYQPFIEDVFETNGLPYHIETRRPFAHAASYRFLKATVDLITAISQGQTIESGDLTDPLRLGFCLPGSQSSIWPLDDRIFLYLEQRLHDFEQRADDDWTFDQWREAAWDAGGWETAWSCFNEFLDWAAEESTEIPQSGSEVRDFLRSVLRSNIYQSIPRQRDSPHGPGVDTTRTNMTRKHPTSVTRRVLGKADNVARYYDYALEVIDVSPSWDEAARAIGDVIGSDTFGVPNTDGQAIRVVDAGNTYFLEAEKVYIVGLSAGTFPVDPDTPSFIHQELRDRVTRLSEEGEQSFLYFDSRRTLYDTEVDFYEATLRACSDEVTALHRYKDSDGRSEAWSPFVDLLPTDDFGHRVRADEWLPEPRNDDGWGSVADTVTQKDRMRLLYHHAERPHPSRRPEVERDDIATIASRTEPEPLQEAVMPRYDRYSRPPMEVTVTPDEDTFEEGLALSDIVGGPFRPHEVDLYSQCELKFYFYQLLFNYEGNSVQRDEIPFYSSSRPDYRLGTLPHVVRHQYVEDSYTDTWQQIVETHLADRQSDLAQFETEEELEEWFTDHDAFSDWDARAILPVLEAERQLVQQELNSPADIDRDWGWAETRDIQAGEHTLRLPGHRRDEVGGTGGYVLPTFFVRHSTYAEKAAKRCWGSPGNNQYRNETCDGLCQSCREFGDCSIPTRFTLDHRLHGIALEDTDVVGVQFQERFSSDPSSRRGYLKNSYVDNLRGGIDGGPEYQYANDSFSSQAWHIRAGTWRDDAEETLEAMSDDINTTGATYRVDQEFVDEGGCEDCVYRGMCMVPNAYGGGQ